MELILSKIKGSGQDLEILQGNWKENIEILELSHSGIIKLENLYELVNIRIAIFSNNKIKKIENLENNVKLEELVGELTGTTDLLPTAALAEIDLEIGAWGELELTGDGTLANLFLPREL